MFNRIHQTVQRFFPNSPNTPAFWQERFTFIFPARVALVIHNNSNKKINWYVEFEKYFLEACQALTSRQINILLLLSEGNPQQLKQAQLSFDDLFTIRTRVKNFMLSRIVNQQILDYCYELAYAEFEDNIRKIHPKMTDNLLHWALVCKQPTEIILSLIEAKVDVNAENRDNTVPLHIAASMGNLDIVKILISAGAHIHARNSDDCTAIMYATQIGDFDVVNLLIQKGINVNIASKSKITSVHLAAQDGYLDILNLLIENHADINAYTKGGNTAFTNAARGKHIACVLALLKNNCQIPNHYADIDNPNLKEEIIKHLSNLPLLLKIELCRDALNANTSLGKLMRLSNGLLDKSLKEIEKIQQAALQEQAKSAVPELPPPAYSKICAPNTLIAPPSMLRYAPVLFPQPERTNAAPPSYSLLSLEDLKPPQSNTTK